MLRQPDFIRAVREGRLRQRAHVRAGEQSHHRPARRIRQLPRLAEQLQRDRLERPASMLQEHPDRLDRLFDAVKGLDHRNLH